MVKNKNLIFLIKQCKIYSRNLNNFNNLTKKIPLNKILNSPNLKNQNQIKDNLYNNQTNKNNNNRANKNIFWMNKMLKN